MEDIRAIPGIIQTRAMGAEDLPEDDDETLLAPHFSKQCGSRQTHSIMDPETTLKNLKQMRKPS